MDIDVNRVVTVNIDRQTQLPQGPGFGTLLIVAPSTTGVITLGERVRSYSSIDGVAADFVAGDEELKAATAYFSQNPRPTSLKIGVRDPLNAIEDEMQAIMDADPDWWGVIVTADGRISEDPTLSLDLAQWIEARSRTFMTSTNEAEALASGRGLIASANGLNLFRTAVFAHADAFLGVGNAYPEAAAYGVMLTTNFDAPASTKTMKFKRPAGLAETALTNSQFDAITANMGNVFTRIGGFPMFAEGTMASGEFFDIMHGFDWLQAEIAFRVFGRLVTMPKVPLTDLGMSILEGEVRLALEQAVTNGFVAITLDGDGNPQPAFELSTQPVASVSPADRAARKGSVISFTARVAGAVHFATIQGTLTV